MRVRYTLIVVAAAGSLLAAACGGDDGGKDSGATTIAAVTLPAVVTAEPNIVIKGFAFTVTPAKAGTITIRNDDSSPHTVTADDGAFSVQVDPGKTATIDVAAAGNYAFHCNFHSSMKATLVVA